MNMELVLKGVELSPLAEERVTKRVEKVVSRVDRELPFRVVLTAEPVGYAASVRLSLAARELNATAHSRENVLTAFDDALDKVERQMAKHFAKRQRKDTGLRGEVAAARSGRAYARW